MSHSDPDVQRAEMLDRWERAAPGWGKRAARMRDFGMPVSTWMIDHLELQPGQRVLELAAGPGETGLLAAELVAPGGTLISSDGAAAMLEVARGRARELGVENVEFKQLELEWIDLSTASIDAVLCRWGVMLSLDPAAALTEMRRVLRPGGRAAIAVWDDASHNPWATIPSRALMQRGLAAPPAPGAPGMFALAGPGLLQEMLESAGFVDVQVESVELQRSYQGADAFIAETFDLSTAFAEAVEGLDQTAMDELTAAISEEVEQFRGTDGWMRLPGRSLVAAAGA